MAELRDSHLAGGKEALKKNFTFSESGCSFAQGRMLREGIERWHKRIALFASFAFSMAWRDT